MTYSRPARPIAPRTFGRLLAVLAAVFIFASPFTAQAQAQDYTPLKGLRVSDGRVQFLFTSAGQCIVLSNSSINGVVYTTHTSKWQRRAGATWVDIPGTEREGLCSYSPTSAGEYRLVAEITIDGERGHYSSENTLTVEGEDDPPETGGHIYYFPHLAVGASWQSTITYINYSPQEVTCQTEFISDHGSPLMVSFAGLEMVVSRTDVLPPGGSVHQETNVELSAPLAPGWARSTCSGPVKASLLFRQRNSEGVPVAEAGINAAAVPATRFVTFAEQGTGVAYANPSATAAHVTFTARDAAGQTLASVDRTLLPGGHDAHNMGSLFGLSSFTGSIEVTSTEPIVSLSLNFEAAPVFSSLPPGEIIDIPGVMLAPADQAAFDAIVVGKRMSSDVGNSYFDFISPGRFWQTGGREGSYTYRNTGSNTGMVTLNYDDGERFTFHLTFASATAGTGIFTYNGESGGFNWWLVEIPSG